MSISLNNHEDRITALENRTSETVPWTFLAQLNTNSSYATLPTGFIECIVKTYDNTWTTERGTVYVLYGYSVNEIDTMNSTAAPKFRYDGEYKITLTDHKDNNGIRVFYR